jgi:hypothetical protein
MSRLPTRTGHEAIAYWLSLLVYCVLPCTLAQAQVVKTDLSTLVKSSDIIVFGHFPDEAPQRSTFDSACFNPTFGHRSVTPVKKDVADTSAIAGEPPREPLGVLQGRVFTLVLRQSDIVLPGEHPGGPVSPDVAQVVMEALISNASPDVVLCIEINGSDPPADFLSQLQRPGKTIVSRSSCHSKAGGSYYGKAHLPAHFLVVSDEIQRSPTELTVQANEWYHGKWAMYWTVHLAHDDSGWRVVSLHLDGEA